MFQNKDRMSIMFLTIKLFLWLLSLFISFSKRVGILLVCHDKLQISCKTLEVKLLNQKMTGTIA